MRFVKKSSQPERAATSERGPFRIQVVAERSGVPSATLRAWERRYGVPVPARTTSAYRLYSAEDIERVREMRSLCESGMAAAEAAKVVLASRPVVAAAPVGQPPANPHEEAQLRILRAAEQLDAEQLDAELMRLGYAGDALTLYERVVAPLLVDVGNLWAAGTVSVAQEHFLSGRLEVMMRNALAAMRPQKGPHVMMACVTDEHHVLGLLGAALQLSGWGARPILLGANTPPAAIADAIRLRRPALVGLSVARVPARPRSLLKDYAVAVDGLPWVVGGEASAEIAPIVQEAGGMVAAPGETDWHEQVLEILRGKPRTPRRARKTETQPP